MCEVMEEATYVPHHKQKIAFLFSAMRHFAQELQTRGIQVRYVQIDDPNNSGDFTGELRRAVLELAPEKIVVTEPGEYRVLQMMKAWQTTLALPTEIRPDTRFLATHADFAAWAEGRKELRMEYFYREMRKKYSILMELGGEPAGGQWNYDKENRKPPSSKMKIPMRVLPELTPTSQQVPKPVEKNFPKPFGPLEAFNFA